MFYGVYVKYKSKFELNGSFNEDNGAAANRAFAFRDHLLKEAKTAGFPAPFIIVRAELTIEALPDKF